MVGISLFCENWSHRVSEKKGTTKEALKKDGWIAKHEWGPHTTTTCIKGFVLWPRTECLTAFWPKAASYLFPFFARLCGLTTVFYSWCSIVVDLRFSLFVRILWRKSCFFKSAWTTRVLAALFSISGLFFSCMWTFNQIHFSCGFLSSAFLFCNFSPYESSPYFYLFCVPKQANKVFLALLHVKLSSKKESPLPCRSSHWVSHEYPAVWC